MISLPAKGPSATAGRAKTCPYLPIMSGRPGALYFPASPAPCVHPRKGGGQMEKTHNTEGLGAENISMFFSNSIANRKGFLPRPALFRAWGQGTGDAGGYNAPGLPNIQGVSSGDNCLTTHVLSIGPVWTGPLRVGYNLESAGEVYERRANPYEGLYGGMQFDASRANAIYGASPTVMPPSVNVPCITYLGLPA